MIGSPAGFDGDLAFDMVHILKCQEQNGGLGFNQFPKRGRPEAPPQMSPQLPLGQVF